MIVKNEEQFLEQCLRSVQSLVDEIVVVDTGSMDKTKEIAASFTPKVFDFAWCDDFAVARNHSLKYAVGEWILVLDADETLSKQDHQAIRELISSVSSAISGFILTQRNYFRSMEDLSYGSFAGLQVSAAGGELNFISSRDDHYLESAGTVGWLPTPIVRLFRRETAAFSGRVHEDASPSLNGKIIDSAIPIHHYGKLNLETWKQKWKLYERLGERKAEEEKDYYAYFELGRQYLNGKTSVGEPRLKDAQRMFERSLELKKDFWLSWFNLGSVHLLLGELSEAVSCLRKAQEYNPAAPQIYLNLGVALVKQGLYLEAEHLFWQGIEKNPQRADLYKNLGLCYLEMKKEREAMIVLKKAVELNPAYAENIHFGKK